MPIMYIAPVFSIWLGITASNNASNNLHVLKGSYQKEISIAQTPFG